ncbi:10962_t:CDS:2, partial [Funneliformis mosseae]
NVINITQMEMFGKSTTQFVIVKDKIVDASNKKVTLTTERSKGNSSNPDILFTDIAGAKILCSNCFMNGEATVSLRVAGEFVDSEIKFTDATFALDGNVKLNVDISLV